MSERILAEIDAPIQRKRRRLQIEGPTHLHEKFGAFGMRRIARATPSAARVEGFAKGRRPRIYERHEIAIGTRGHDLREGKWIAIRFAMLIRESQLVDGIEEVRSGQRH